MARATILVVDDSDNIRTLINYRLTGLGFHVVEAANGHEAVRLARSCQPSVILLDLCMPGMDGLDAASHICTDPALEDVPIIAMSAYGVEAMHHAALSVGCRHFMVKPFDLAEMTENVNAFVS